MRRNSHILPSLGLSCLLIGAGYSPAQGADFTDPEWALCGEPGHAPRVPRPTDQELEQAETHLSSDQSEVLGKEIFNFSGNVEVRRADQELYSDRARYNRSDATVEAEGNVRYTQSGLGVDADSAFFNLASVYTWLVSGGIRFEIGFLIDKLTALMMVVVTFVSLMVHIYTIGYMRDDPGYQRFFSYIALFTFSMLMLVMANNFLQLFFGWEAVGLVSYLLIGFWYQRESAIYANLKAFLVNRVGDMGFLLGIAAVLLYFNTLDYAEVFQAAPQLAQHTIEIIPGYAWSVMTVICLLLFIGAMGKSAQVPLHVWLPDSMEGPTPISALIHAATMVTAGIFMVARMSPLFELSETALSVVLVIGAVTALFMGLLGIVQNDIKRVIAYSTLSQLGYMTVALGASAYAAGIFHLMTHAFYKALLFLAAGSVIIALHHEQDIRKMGGLYKYLPWTYGTFLIGTLALIGFPGFSGFFSKDAIIEAVRASQLAGSGFAYAAAEAEVSAPHHDLSVTLEPGSRLLTVTDKVRFTGSGMVQLRLAPEFIPQRLTLDGKALSETKMRGALIGGLRVWTLALGNKPSTHTIELHYRGTLAPLLDASARATLGSLPAMADARGSYLPASYAWYPDLGAETLTYTLALDVPATQRA